VSERGRDLGHELRHGEGDDLTRALLEAPAGELEAILDNPALADEQMMLLLRRPDVPTELLQRVASAPRWTGTYLVKAALVAHPHTPKVVALTLAKYLFWRDLTKLIANLNLDPSVRRMAEVLLRDRIGEISLGERIALARIAPREVLKSLRADHNEKVMAALLTNPRLTEEDALWIANNRKIPPALLELLARSQRWIARYPLRLALVRNPRTPFAAATGVLATLAERDLKAVAEHPEIPAGIRATARRLLAERPQHKSPGS
jgi:hypothetical protein